MLLKGGLSFTRMGAGRVAEWAARASGPGPSTGAPSPCSRVSADGLRNVLASRGVIVSSGSACAAPGGKPSGALAAIGLPASWGMVRVSFGLDTELAEVEHAAGVLVEAVRDLAT